MIKTFDLIVVGAGVFGAWTADELARRGRRVGLLDAYGAANTRSSSGGESRIIRMGYGADEIYTRWARHSMGAWLTLAEESGQPLFHRTGVMRLAREGDSQTRATIEVFDRLGVRFERLRGAALAARFPQIAFDADDEALYEPESGALMARRAVFEVVRRFERNGGTVLSGAVIAPRERGRLTTVTTAHGETFGAEAFVFACGPWFPKLFPELLGERIHPTRQEVFFFGIPAGETAFAPSRMPTWVDFEAGFYGMPDLESRGFKIGLDRHGPSIDPDTDERAPTPAILAEIRAFLARRFPALRDAPLLESRICQYENTSNGDFLIDRHPDLDNVWLLGGGSGHGFKHGPAISEHLADLLFAQGAAEPRFALQTKGTQPQRAVY